MRAGTNPKMLDAIKSFVMNDTKTQLAVGFKFAYQTLIKSLSEFDYSTVSQATEGQLYNSFAEGMDQIR